MTNEELKLAITLLLPSASYDETGEFLNVIISSEELLPLIKELRYKDELLFDYLFCLTCVDWKDHLMMVYHLTSKTHNHTLVVKGKISKTTSVAAGILMIFAAIMFVLWIIKTPIKKDNDQIV